MDELVFGNFREDCLRMMQKVLVAYATKHGSTAEIGATLQETGLVVDVLPVAG